ncbi:UDP-N-acetylmuramoyl-L-alanine--D-glutamate ligase [Candidatus Parcubacteria bacterium]|nr:UDP-N-acetylmuramoyl-L-alanine--D-glutamate ligase [Patescibacteria group bacterium]MBU4309655.1 UDP-N-acetylmuramoyl-L-alanine--D-glutamate ligase [Patescibacteria group bacterium]MBU4432039.1 UDP-N-acetylmuramoyl-L-alanine--D-glutamate ligase [Patescibacteria group bacterium]MBU4577957.1 UDP-N-acetylmuramoyl-L-alanine--D-glutamate ligase [Patescibacteria group bacterium]MCG2696534.1 UDP-N-acetylmuramoyl-L-alanine--D-glutamate ligase [Candidatus Parcubacteria bacterium]
MKLNELKKKKIAILGLGVENYFLIKYLLKEKVECEITICDLRSEKQLGEKYLEFSKLGVQWKLEAEFNRNLGVFNILFRSPGWPIACPGVQAGLKEGSLLFSAMNLFFELCPTTNLIGVTGTKGKGTTSSLIVAILKTAKKRVWLGGNIGVAPFSFINKIKKNDWVVLELSSFQLEDLHKSPHIAVLTNFSPEHLAPADPFNPNFHQNLKSYWDAKANLFIHQKKNDYLVANYKVQDAKCKTSGRIIKFTKSELVSGLVGEHNKENVAAALEVAKILKIDEGIAGRTVKSFKGLEHRIEKVAEVKGIIYYDDSFATIPDSAIIALKSFTQAIILLAGGADKGADFKNFAKEIKKRVKFLVLFKGVGSERIIIELERIKYSADKYIVVDDMNKAIIVARKKAVAGDIVLLSPACASFGVFKNYKERGNLFKEGIMK